MKQHAVKTFLFNAGFLIVFFLLIHLISNAIDALVLRTYDGWPGIIWALTYHFLFGLYLSYPHLFAMFRKQGGPLRLKQAQAMLAGLVLLVLVVILCGALPLYHDMYLLSALFGFFLPPGVRARNCGRPGRAALTL